MNKKIYGMMILVGVLLSLSFSITLVNAQSWTLGPNQYALKTEYLNKGDHLSWRFTAPYGDMQVYVFNSSAYENRGVSLDSSDYYYKSNRMFSDYDAEWKGGFTAPYDNTWKICFINRHYMYYTVFTITLWEITEPEPDMSAFLPIILVSATIIIAIVVIISIANSIKKKREKDEVLNTINQNKEV